MNRSSEFLILVPFIAVMMSPPMVTAVPSIVVWVVPACMPALAAGPPAVIWVTRKQ